VTPQEAAAKAAEVLAKAETDIDRGNGPARAHALRCVADGWTQLAVVLATHPSTVGKAS